MTSNSQETPATSKPSESGLISDLTGGPDVSLYRLFTENGALLYVGISGDFRVRFGQHKADKAWWPEVYRYTVDWFPTRADALTAEAAAIISERPLHNAQGTPEPRPPRTPDELPAVTPGTLLTITDITGRHRVSRQGLQAHRRHPAFPVPVPNSASSRPRWRAEEVDAYYAAHPPRPGARTDLVPAG